MRDVLNAPLLIAALLSAFGQAAGRVLAEVWTYLVGRVLTTVIIEPGTPLYDWVEDWIAAHPSSAQCDRFTAHLEMQPAPASVFPLAVPLHTTGVQLRPATNARLFRHEGRLIYLRRSNNPTATRSMISEIGGGGGNAIPRNINEAAAMPVQSTVAHQSLAALEIAVVGRGAGGVQKLLSEIAAEREAERRATRQTDVFVMQGGGWRRLLRRSLRSAESVILPEDMMQEIVTDCATFRAGEAVYNHLGIPWRRGILLEGLPGTGKTSAIQAVAAELGLDLYVIHLASIPNDDYLMNLLMDVPPDVAVLFEDIDAAWKEEEPFPYNPPKRKGGTRRLQTLEEEAASMYERKLEGLTLSGLLNCLDGVIAPEGRLTFFTTNYVKRLPSRLLRPGRVDRRFTFGPATLSQVGRMWERFFPLAPETAKQEFLNAVFPVAKTPPFVMAQVQQYLLLYRDSWEEGLDNRNRFHEIVKPVEGTNE